MRYGQTKAHVYLKLLTVQIFFIPALGRPGAKFSKSSDKLKYNLGTHIYIENYT